MATVSLVHGELRSTLKDAKAKGGNTVSRKLLGWARDGREGIRVRAQQVDDSDADDGIAHAHAGTHANGVEVDETVRTNNNVRIDR